MIYVRLLHKGSRCDRLSLILLRVRRPKLSIRVIEYRETQRQTEKEIDMEEKNSQSKSDIEKEELYGQ